MIAYSDDPPRSGVRSKLKPKGLKKCSSPIRRPRRDEDGYVRGKRRKKREEDW